MAAIKFLNLFALSSLALLACSFGATPVNALSVEGIHARDVSAHGHAAIAKRNAKRDSTSTVNGKRCKVRSSSAAPAPTSASSSKKAAAPSTSSKPASTKAAASTSKSSAKASSTSSSAKSVSTASTSTGKKVGLAWANGDSNTLSNFVSSHTQYLYTWSPEYPPNTKSLGLTPMPMLWGPNQINDFKKLVVKGYANIACGFNEPNEDGQSNMDPGYGATLWIEYLEPLLNEGYELLAPTTSSNPNGRTWVDNWYTACKGKCHPTYHGVHYYDVTAQGMITYIEQWHSAYGKPIMVTEFACQNFNGGSQCSVSETDAFWKTVVEWMEASSFVTAYFGFGIMTNMQGVNTDNQLMTSSGKPTALGQKYLDVSW